MGITKEYQVIENRLFFKCPACGSKRTVMVPPELRQVSTHCHKCGDVTRCRLNRRARLREQQAGKILLITETGQEFEINLNDISDTGVGFELPIGLSRAKVVSAGDVVRFRCSWNPHLLGNFRYVVKSVRGQRVGAKKVAL